MNCFTEEQLNRISHLVKEIEKLSDAEKLFLYLQLPCGRAEGKPKYNGQSKSDLSHKKTDQETTQTYTWILSHLESDPNVSLPKQEVYDEYRAFCQSKRFEPMCVADFGKAMKHAFPSIKPRRLGQRGNSRYCYSGLRKKYKIQPPSLPDMIEPTFCIDNDCSHAYNKIIEECQDNPDECPLNTQPNIRGYEVMNLKVEPSSPHNQQQQQQPQYTANGNGLRFSDGTPKQTSAQFKDLGGSGDCLRTQQNCSAVNCPSMISHAPVSLNDSNYNPSTLTPMTSQAAQMSSFSFQETIRPPGTPDDDDYHHNYQDVLPMIRSESSSVNMPPSHQASRYPQTTSHYIYEQPPESKSLRDINEPCSQSSSLSLNLMVGGTNGDQQQSPIDQAHINPNSMHQISVGTQFNMSHMHQCANIESCTSPFQSPAPTPYPPMTSYLSADIPDYYSDECIRYVNS